MSSKGVEDWLFLMTLKLERLDDGLVADRDGVNLAENGVWLVWLSAVVKPGSVVGYFFEKRPKLSLSYVVASIANVLVSSVGCQVVPSLRDLVVLILRVLNLSSLVVLFLAVEFNVLSSPVGYGRGDFMASRLERDDCDYIIT